MPVYEYSCLENGHVVEVVASMRSEPPASCPECGSGLRRVWGRVGVRFSGWGFRSTDALLPADRRRKDFRTLKEKAEEISDSD